MLKKTPRTQRRPKLRALRALRNKTPRYASNVPYTPSNELEQLKRSIMN